VSAVIMIDGQSDKCALIVMSVDKMRRPIDRYFEDRYGHFNDIRRKPGRKTGGRSASQRNFRKLAIARTHDIGRRYPDRAAAIVAGLASAFGRSAFAMIASNLTRPTVM